MAQAPTLASMAGLPLSLPSRLPWPLPALLAWAGGWAACAALPAPWAVVAGCAAGGLLAMANTGWRRRAIAAAGFPLSALALGLVQLPPWLWLLLLAPLLAAYPLRAWRDAPFFPTPADALGGLAAVVKPPPASVLDAGCGAGHGLQALRAAWPQAALSGVEWSAPLAALAGLRCRSAAVRRGDMWAGSWAEHGLVYVFQRPESMARAWAKAAAEMTPGSWLVSLEFAVPDTAPHATLRCPDGRPLWLYRVPSNTAASGR